MSTLFFFNSITLGVGLSMDAFSISVVNGMNETSMSKSKAIKVASVYSFFQALMTMLGWLCTHTVIIFFDALQDWIPWISLILLLMIGINMIKKGKSCNEASIQTKRLSPRILLLQGIATSIDALSAGLTIADYNILRAFVCALIIAEITMVLCIAGIRLGKNIGIKMAEQATVLGGIILILIGIEICLTGILC